MRRHVTTTLILTTFQFSQKHDEEHGSRMAKNERIAYKICIKNNVYKERVMKAHIEHELLGEEVVGNHSTVLSLFYSIAVLLLGVKDG